MTDEERAAVQERICERLSEGESLRSICSDADMPNARTVFRWVSADEGFRAEYEAAIAVRATLMAEGIIELADKATDKDSAAAVRVQVDARKWLAGKLHPKRYGDALLMKQADANGDPLKPQMTPIEIATRLASLVQAARQKNPEAFARLETGHVGEE